MDDEGRDNIVDQMEQVVEEHFYKQERETALDLIRHGFFALPYELKELYSEVAELHRQGKFEESSNLFEVWMQQAREMDLI